ncbi:MAG: transporter permease [Firmicutes bacterium]|nr:transporter permease [Bacillota bacterium]
MAMTYEKPAGARLGSRVRDLAGASWRPAVFLVVVFIVWWAATALGWVKPYLIPPPAKVWEAMTQDKDLLLKHTRVTLYETFIGFILAVLAGQLAAIAIVFSPTVEKTLYPILLFAQVVPKIAIAPLFVVWMGFGPGPKILSAVLIAFFPVVISGVAGLRSVDPELLDLAAIMGAGVWKTFMKIRFPASLPHLFSGLKVAATLAVTGAVVGEFVGSNEGLGYILLIANGNLNAALLFAGLIIMSLIGVLFFVAIEVAEALLMPWHASRRRKVEATM